MVILEYTNFVNECGEMLNKNTFKYKMVIYQKAVLQKEPSDE